MVVNSQTRLVIAFALVLLLAVAPCASASVLKLSRNDELKIGKDFYASYSKEHKYLDTTREGVLVKKIGARLVQRNAVKDWDFVFTLVDDKDVNAFAVPGGYVFINKGLYDYIGYDEAMLAAVLGHEMSHVRERHYKKMYDKAITAQIGVALAGLVIGGDQGQDVANVLGLGSSLVFLKYSRDEEEQADRDGIGLAFTAGYDPYGMTRNMRLFQQLESKLGQDELFDLWRTHPQPAERIARCESIAKELSGKTESSYHPPTAPSGYDYGNTGSSNPNLLAPAVIVATDGTYADRIRITWKPSKGASNYIIYRASSQDGNFTQIGQSGSTSYDDYINDGGTYWYMVRASNSYGYSDYSSADSGYPGNGNGNGSGSMNPGLPSSINASDGTYADFVRIKWAASSNAAYYNIYRSTDLNGNYVNVGKTSSTTFDDAVPSYKVFWYKVRAVNSKGASPFTDADSGFRGKAGQPGTQTKAPTPPSNVMASDGSYGDMVRITWTASAGATSYKVYRATSQGANYTYIGQISTNFYEDYVNDDNVYWYKVRSINSFGGSGYSNADSGYMGNGTQSSQLLPPANVSASDGNYTDAIRITWSASSGATGYKVYRSASQDGDYAYVGQSNASPYDDYDVDTDVYWYKVTTANSYEESVYSSADSGYKAGGAQQPLPPSNVAASDGTYTDVVRITWTASDGATNYKVYRATSQNGNYTYIGQSDSSPYDDYDSDTYTFWYKIKASNSYGDSDYSYADSGYKGTGPQIPNVPVSLAASDGTYADMVQVSWAASTGATSYKVYRSASQNGNYSYIGQTSSTLYEDYVNDSSFYWYKVRAINAFGGSGYSNADRGYRGNGSQQSSPPPNTFVNDEAVLNAGGAFNVFGLLGSVSYAVSGSGTNSYSHEMKANRNKSDKGGEKSDANKGNKDSQGDKSKGDNKDKGKSKHDRSSAYLPSAPANVEASDGTYENMIRITWTESDRAEYYKIYRATSKGGKYAYIGEVNSGSYDDYVKSSNRFWYKVRAVNSDGGSRYSSADSGRRSIGNQEPNATNNDLNSPMNLSASDGTYQDMIRVTWAESSGAEYYKVYRAASKGGSYALIGESTTFYFEDLVNSSNDYWYRVRAITSSGGSQYSNADSGYRNRGPQEPGPVTNLPNAPTNLAASDGVYQNMIRVTWNDNGYAAIYKVYRSTAQNGNYTLIGQTSSTFYEDQVNGTNYYWYKVRAINDFGGSTYSNADRGYGQ